MRHRTKSVATTLLIGLITILFTGCGNQSQESGAVPPPDSGTALQPTEPPIPAPEAEPAPAQENQKSTETAKAPDGMPLPIYPGFKIENSLRTQTGDFQGMQVKIVGDASLQAVADFYKAEFQKRGLQISEMTQQSEVLVLGQTDKITAGISATREDNKTRVVLSWSEKK